MDINYKKAPLNGAFLLGWMKGLFHIVDRAAFGGFELVYSDKGRIDIVADVVGREGVDEGGIATDDFHGLRLDTAE